MNGFDKRVKLVAKANGSRYNKKLGTKRPENIAPFQHWSKKTLPYKDTIERIEMSEETKQEGRNKMKTNLQKVLALLEKRKLALVNPIKKGRRPKKIKEGGSKPGSKLNQKKMEKERLAILMQQTSEIYGEKKEDKSITEIQNLELLNQTISQIEKMITDLNSIDSVAFQELFFKCNNQKKIKEMICTKPEMFVSDNPADENLSICETRMEDELKMMERMFAIPENSLLPKNYAKCFEELGINSGFLGVRIANPNNNCFLNVLVHVFYEMNKLRDYILNNYFACNFLQELKLSLHKYKEVFCNNSYETLSLDKLRKVLNTLSLDDYITREHDCGEVFRKIMETIDQEAIAKNSNIPTYVDLSNFIVQTECIKCDMTISNESNELKYILKKNVSCEKDEEIDNIFFKNRVSCVVNDIEKGVHTNCQNGNETFDYYIPPVNLMNDYIWLMIHSQLYSSNQFTNLSQIEKQKLEEELKRFVEKIPLTVDQSNFKYSNDNHFEYELKAVICLKISEYFKGVLRHYTVYTKNSSNNWIFCNDTYLRAFTDFEKVKNDMVDNENYPYYFIFSKLNELEKKKTSIIEASFK
jgi:hypothetical protein